MKPIAFTKMNGSGNDFIIIDNRCLLEAIIEADVWVAQQSAEVTEIVVDKDLCLIIHIDKAGGQSRGVRAIEIYDAGSSVTDGGQD